MGIIGAVIPYRFVVLSSEQFIKDARHSIVCAGGELGGAWVSSLEEGGIRKTWDPGIQSSRWI